MTTTQAIRTAEQAWDTHISNWLDQIADYSYDDGLYFEESTLQKQLEEKHKFLTFEIEINQFVINAGSPTFFENCPIVGYLLQECFKTVTIDDEYNLIVTLPHNVSTYSDLEYVATSFVAALKWLPIWEAERKAYQEYILALTKWNELSHQIINIKRA